MDFQDLVKYYGNKLGYNCGNMENLSSQLLKFTNMFPKSTFIFYHFYSDFELGEKFEIKGNELKHRKVIIQIDYSADTKFDDKFENEYV